MPPLVSPAAHAVPVAVPVSAVPGHPAPVMYAPNYPAVVPGAAPVVFATTTTMPAEIPDHVRAYDGLLHTMQAYLFTSIVQLVFSPWSWLASAVPSILGIVASSMYVCDCCGGRRNMESTVRNAKYLSAAAASLSLLAGFIGVVLAIAEEEVQYFLFMGLWNAAHAVFGAHVFKRLDFISRMLDPVTSGQVSL